MKLYFSLTLAVIILVMDLLTKRWVELNLTYGQQIMITEFFNLVLTYNAGAAFSFLSDASGWQRWFLSTIAVLVSVLIVYLLYKNTANRLFCFALSLILGGALGNLWDRIMLGHVADSAIFCGAFLLILDSIRNGRNDSVQEG